MARVKLLNVISGWAFFLGVILAIVFGVFRFPGSAWMIALMAIGLLVGLVNVVGKETMPFLLSGAVLILASGLGRNGLESVAVVENIFNALLAIFVPATVIVAIKNVFVMAKKR